MVALVLLVLAYDVEARAFGTTTQHRVARWNIITRIELQLFCKVFQLWLLRLPGGFRFNRAQKSSSSLQETLVNAKYNARFDFDY